MHALRRGLAGRRLVAGPWRGLHWNGTDIFTEPASIDDEPARSARFSFFATEEPAARSTAPAETLSVAV